MVDVPGIEPLEVRLEELRQLMADHLAETSPHWEHFHPHAPHTASLELPGHSDLIERLAQLVSDLIARAAHAQAPPPLDLYSGSWQDSAGRAPPSGSVAPASPIATSVPLLAALDAALTRLRRDINAHAANVNAHPHSHTHTHSGGGTQWTTVDPNADTDGDGIIDTDDDDDDGDGVLDADDADPLDPAVQ